MSAQTSQFQVGSITCVPVSDGGFAYPRELVFGAAPPEARDRVLAERQVSGDVPSSFTCLLVDTGRHTVLVDTGMGPFAPSTGKLPESLRRAGYAPEDIDTVILTHGHPDHIGGNVDAEGRPAFPNARYIMWEDEWRFWTAEANLDRLAAGQIYRLGELESMMATFARTNLLPLRDRIELVNRERELVPGIQAIAAPGHTPHHIALAISSGSDALLCAVDTAINPIHLEHPEWSPLVDQDAARALATRRRLLDRAASEGTRVFVYHYAFPGLGRVARHGDAWRWEPDA